MVSVLRAVVTAFAFFSAIPMPHVEWDEKNMRYMMAAFPLVGVVIGLLVLAWRAACDALGLGQLLWGAGFALIPLSVTGGIHMDGFADVTDARASHAEPARKREILKDPHVGSFAVMAICCYIVSCLALACELDARYVPLAACAPVASRCLAGIVAVSARLSSRTGMLASVSGSARTNAVQAALVLELLAVAAVLAWLSPLVGPATLAVAVVALAATVRMANREFGGMSGDLSGYYVQVAELAMLACVVLVGRLV